MMEKLKLVFLSTVVVILTCAFFVLLYKSSFYFFSALIGVGVACLIAPLVDYFENNYKINRFVATLIIFIVLGIIALLLFYLSGSILVNQFSSFTEDLPEILKKWEELWYRNSIKLPLLSKVFSNEGNSEVFGFIMKYISMGLLSSLETLSGLSLSIVIALFTSANYNSYFTSLQKMIHRNQRALFKQRSLRTAQTLRKWFYAQFLDMCVVGTLTTLGLWVVGIKYWALYGALAGLLSIIPFAGLVFVFVFSGLIISVTQPDKLIYLIIVFIVTQNLEGNFIMPKLMKDHVKIPSAPLVFLLIIMGSWFGIIGALVATPLLAILISELKHLE